VVVVEKHLSLSRTSSRAPLRLERKNPHLGVSRRRGQRRDFRKNGCSPNRMHVPRAPLFSARRRISSIDPFGNTLSKSGPLADANTYRFSSQEYHQPSGLSLYLNRAYDPNLQRWLNRDPIEERGGLNLYGSLGNDPVNAVDPLGLWNLWNPATWGDANPNGWSVLNSLTPWHESSGYTWEGIKWNTGQAAQATLDGIIPFADFFKNNGGYDPCDKSLAWSRRLGAFSRDVYGGRLFSGLFSGGSSSALYSGEAAQTATAEVFPETITLSKTLGGKIVENYVAPVATRLFGKPFTENVVWRGASALFAGNAKGLVPVVIEGAPAATKIIWTELKVIQFLGNAKPVLLYVP